MTKLSINIDAADYEAAVDRAVVLANKLRRALDKIEKAPIKLSLVSHSDGPQSGTV